jgi:hypothetical protein
MGNGIVSVVFCSNVCGYNRLGPCRVAQNKAAVAKNDCCVVCPIVTELKAMLIVDSPNGNPDTQNIRLQQQRVPRKEDFVFQ